MVNITKDPSIALLNEPVENIPRYTQTLIYYKFLAAKISIATAWKSPVIDLALMKRKLTWIMLHEKLVSVLRDKQPLFEKVWTPWLSYLQVPNT